MVFNYDPPWYPIFGLLETPKYFDPPRIVYMGFQGYEFLVILFRLENPNNLDTPGK
jgi:hypothetical protein